MFENDFAKQNYTLLCDFYELTMGCGYLGKKMQDTVAYFDLFFRKIPDEGGFAIACGLEQVINYIKNLSFTESDIEFLRSKNTFTEEFLEYLRDFKFTGDIYAIPEGTPVFPGEPLITVRAPIMQAQLVETYLLLTVNHQSLVATKANRIVRAAQGRGVSEFGSRRAQGVEAAILGARAAYIGGCSSTACAIAEKWYGVPAVGTMAHSWIQSFASEYEAFDAYCEIYPKNPVLLIDTYNVLKSGLPNAVKIFKKHGITKCGVRIDSGDITYLTKKIRQKLDEEGLPDCKIIVSNSLDENIIRDILSQGAVIDSFGVGERLITSKSDPVFGGVYKLVATENENGKITPKIKISENIGKITTPCFKKIYRIFKKETGKATADYICTYDEKPDFNSPLTIFDPENTWKEKTITDYFVEELQVPIFKDGKLVYNMPSTHEIRDYCLKQIDRLWDEVKRFEYPHNYYVDLSRNLWDIKHELLRKASHTTD